MQESNKRSYSKLIYIWILCGVILSLSSCSMNRTSGGDIENQDNVAVVQNDEDNQPNEGAPEDDQQSVSADINSEITNIVLGDMIEVDNDFGVTVDGSVIRITEEGSYRISGTLQEGQIVLNCDGGKFILELAGIELTNSKGPAILVEDAKQTDVILLDGTENILTDGGDDKEYEAVLFSDDDLLIDGTGTLIINGNNQEGIESNDILTINNGTIRITAPDDAVNAGDGIVINGGYIYADCEGDGIDSNGYMTINGGTILLFAGNNKNGPLDVEDGFAFTMNGGTVIAGGGDMGIDADISSKQNSIWLYSDLTEGTLVQIAAVDNEETESFTVLKDCSAIFYSSDKLEENKVYNISTGGSHTGAQVDGLYGAGNYESGRLLGNVTMNENSVSFVSGGQK